MGKTFLILERHYICYKLMGDYPIYDDCLLASMLKNGDEQAFTELYNRYWERMVTIAFVKLQSTSDAKEVVQEVFFDLWQRRKNLQAQQFQNWLFGAIKYKILTYLSRQHRSEQRNVTMASYVSHNDTNEYLSYTDLKAKIEVFVNKLPEKCRLVYRLSREEELSLPEIATALHISQKTAEAHLTKALKTLRSQLKHFTCFL